MEDKTLQEYQEEILKLDADIANLSVKVRRLRIDVCTMFFPQYKAGTRVKFEYSRKEKCGIIISSSLNKDNPFRVRIEVKPTKNDFSEIAKVVVHPVFIDSSKIREIVEVSNDTN